MNTTQSGKGWLGSFERRLLVGLLTPITIGTTMGILLFNSDLEFTAGELILSAAACKLIRLHGVEPEAIPGEAVCRVRGKYWFHSDPERFGKLKVVGQSGVIEIELPGRQILSRAKP